MDIIGKLMVHRFYQHRVVFLYNFKFNFKNILPSFFFFFFFFFFFLKYEHAKFDV
jgi:Na+/H+ antiporter NhaC